MTEPVDTSPSDGVNFPEVDDDAWQADKLALVEEIQEAMDKVAAEKAGIGIKSISRSNKGKVVNILMAFSRGSTQSKICRDYGYNWDTVAAL
ncbi:MAG TPA: hypothetical protein V6D20_01325, partial [Candidatus Obscuribacterales bacterium]